MPMKAGHVPQNLKIRRPKDIAKLNETTVLRTLSHILHKNEPPANARLLLNHDMSPEGAHVGTCGFVEDMRRARQGRAPV